MFCTAIENLLTTFINFYISACVRRWGPLWATSVFPFESFNGFLANSVHGTKNMGQEVINNLMIALGAAILRNQCLAGEHTTYHYPSNVKKDYELLGSTQELKFINDIEREILMLNGLRIENLSIYAREIKLKMNFILHNYIRLLKTIAQMYK